MYRCDKAAWPAVLLAAFLSAGACGPSAPPPRASELVGTWSGAGDGSIRFAADASFTARSLPAALLSGEEARPAVDGNGTWSIDTSRHPPVVDLVFKVVGNDARGYRTIMRTEREGGALVLYFDLDDEGFERYAMARD